MALSDGPLLLGSSPEGRFILASTCPDALDEKIWTQKYLSRDPLVLVLVLVLVLIKDHFIIKRMLAQKASVYPGFILMSVIII